MTIAHRIRSTLARLILLALWAFYIAFFLLTIYLAARNFAAFASAAPIPPALRLTEEMLYGYWEMRWGTVNDCEIVFYRDGTAWERYDKQQYMVRWWFTERGELVLREQRINDNYVSPLAGTCTLRVNNSQRQTLVFTSDSDTIIVLTKPLGE